MPAELTEGMTDYGQASWEERWTKALAAQGEHLSERPPDTQLTTELADLSPGIALDAGCGHGAETLWLASRGWRVTAVDFSANALDFARSTADTMGPEVSGRIEWVQADLGEWEPPQERFDLVASLFVHVEGSVGEMVRRLASGVAVGGTLFMIGHQPIDPVTGAKTSATGQTQVSVEDARAALDSEGWEVITREERERARIGSGVDAVIRARRL